MNVRKFIEAHGHRTRASDRPGFIEAEVRYCGAPSEWEPVKLTIGAARDWLGY